MMNSKKIKKLVLTYLPYVIFAYLGDKLSFTYRNSTGKSIADKLINTLNGFINGLSEAPVPSFDKIDLLVGLGVGVGMFFFMQQKKKNAKKFRQGEEYGSATWGTPKDIEPYMDAKDKYNNVILTQTESLTMGRPSSPKYARNKNILVIGGSGSGKTRFFVKPNLMQMHSSYVVTDPKGTVLVECGKMLRRGRPKKDEKGKIIRRKGKNGKERIVYEPYKIKVFNTIDFGKSMHYNPFVYISEKNREKDILKFVETLIKNTSSSQQPSGDDFWVKAEKLLYTAYIAMIFALEPEERWNFETLIDMVNDSECREDDETFRNSIALQFEFLEYWIDFTGLPDRNEALAKYINENGSEKGFDEYYENLLNEYYQNRMPGEDELDEYFKATFYPEAKEAFNNPEFLPTPEQIRIGSFAIKQYKAYKLAAGKTAKSILISCSTRLAPFAIDEVTEITRYDELELDKLGDRLTALFVIISDTDATFNFLVAIMYSQLFNLLCTKADNSPGGRLQYHVRCLLDEFANIGEIPNFDKLIATIRSREISASIILQAKSQLKAIYKDNADTIEGNCDTMLFLGGKEKTTLKEISESLGKETIDAFNTSENRGQSQSYGLNYQRLGKELKTQDELAVMDGGKCILQLRGVRPFFSDKFDITKHDNYGLLLDSNKANEFDIAAFVETVKKEREKRTAESVKPTEDAEKAEYEAFPGTAETEGETSRSATA